MQPYFKVNILGPTPYVFCVTTSRLLVVERVIKDMVTPEALENHLQGLLLKFDESMQEQLREDGSVFRAAYYEADDQDDIVHKHFLCDTFFDEQQRYIRCLIAMLSDTIDMFTIYKYYVTARAAGQLFVHLTHMPPISADYAPDESDAKPVKKIKKGTPVKQMLLH